MIFVFGEVCRNKLFFLQSGDFLFYSVTARCAPIFQKIIQNHANLATSAWSFSQIEMRSHTSLMQNVSTCVVLVFQSGLHSSDIMLVAFAGLIIYCYFLTAYRYSYAFSDRSVAAWAYFTANVHTVRNF